MRRELLHFPCNLLLSIPFSFSLSKCTYNKFRISFSECIMCSHFDDHSLGLILSSGEGEKRKRDGTKSPRLFNRKRVNFSHGGTVRPPPPSLIHSLFCLGSNLKIYRNQFKNMARLIESAIVKKYV